jgi:hypothetical protein
LDAQVHARERVLLVDVGLVDAHAVDAHLAVLEVDLVARQADHALDVVDGRIERVLSTDDVAAGTVPNM